MQLDPGTAIVGGGLVLASRDLLNKLLGPTAEYIGEETRNFVEKWNINLDNIFRKALRRLGDRAETPGVVSPRVLRHVMDEGRFIEDELAAEYYGGLLASSRTEDGKDDRAVPYLNVIKELSTFQIRLHYLFYMLVKQIFDGKGLNIQIATDCQKMEILIPDYVMIGAMEIGGQYNAFYILGESIEGLARHNLVNRVFTLGDREFIKKIYEKAEHGGVILRPSPFGASLFLWVSGYPNVLPNGLLEEQVTVDEAVIDIMTGASSIRLHDSD